MKGNVQRLGRKRRLAASVMLVAALAAFGASCGGDDAVQENLPPAESPTAAAQGSGATATPEQAPLAMLKTAPEVLAIGETFTLTGEGLQAGREFQIQWATVDGAYRVELENNSQMFYERKFTPTRVDLGRVTTTADGKLEASFQVPEDFGEFHDIYAVADGQDVAKGGVRVPRTLKMTPSEGPVGTLISFEGQGLGYRPYESTMAVRYDNRYVGFMSATTTGGTVKAQIRASGGPGTHVIDIGAGSHALFYLNAHQSPVAYIPDFKFVFTITEDAGAPPARVDWPGEVIEKEDAARTTLGLAAPTIPDAEVTISPPSGPILSEATLKATGLEASSEVEVLWITVSGSRVRGGWDVGGKPVAKSTVAADGTFNARFTVPDDLGGWHAVRLVQGEKVLAEAPYYIERSLLAVTPGRVKAGEEFTVQLKGVGWTELDNTVAITYDNAYMGYACGFNTGGDVTLILTATGGPGTHLIDIYPTIYDGGHGMWPWQYTVPQLSSLTDAPGLALGYRLPVIRVAIEVIE